VFWNKKPASDPLGVPLAELEALLTRASVKTSLKDGALVASHQHYATRIDVVPPESRDSPNGPIRAVVRIVTELPAPMQVIFKGREASALSGFNAFSALGALYSEGGTVRVGSRLTIYEAENAWASLHLPVLFFATVFGADAILGSMRRVMAEEAERGGKSDWTLSDFRQVEGYLSRVCVCTLGNGGLTAEFGLADGAVSAARGDHRTALFQLIADQPHPELGGGLFCLLQMPHRFSEEEQLQRVCLKLNRMEMEALDRPPHFGAWCPGRLGNNPAYAMFLPNAVHSVSGIATNTAFWAMIRARMANEMLASMGVS